MMTVAELLLALQEHAADGRRTQDEVYVRVGREIREVSASYSDGTFLLVAGKVVNGGRRGSR
jgi:hypothetical protein